MDGTLVAVGDAHTQGFRTALYEVYGLTYDLSSKQRLTYQGYSQPNAIRIICRGAGLSAEVIEARLAEAVRIKTQATNASLAPDLRSVVLPGVVDLLSALQLQGHGLCLTTGTASPTAEVILERSGLQRYFPVRACGDEAETRVDLVRLGLRRAIQAYELPTDGNRIVVVGDAPVDIETGKAVGARTVAVATGVHSIEQLAEIKPDAVLASLGDWRAAQSALLS